MKKIITFFLLLTLTILSAQENKGVLRYTECAVIPTCNLVYNGDFEEFSSIPTAINQLERACNWIAGYGDPDYFHASSLNPALVIPGVTPANPNPTVNSNFGGNAYSGFYIERHNDANPQDPDLLSTKLVQPLAASTAYVLEFDVRKSAHRRTNTSIIIQAYFSTTPPPPNFNTGPAASGIFLENNSLSTNKTNWETIALPFTTGATAGQQYLSIGGIFDVLFLPDDGIPSTTTVFGAYYYVDNVRLRKAFNPTFDMPTSVCSTAGAINLSTLVGNTTDTFSGAGVVLVSGEYFFNPGIAGVGTHTITYNATNPSGCDTVSLTDTIEVTDCTPPQPPYISQTYVYGTDNRFIEVKNPNNFTISSGAYYLALYADGAPTSGSPTSFVSVGAIAAQGAKVFKNPASAAPAYALGADDWAGLSGFNGNGDIIVLTTSIDANAHANRIDLFGDATSIGENTSLIRMSCTPMGFPRIDAFDEQDWVAFTDAEVTDPNSKTNAVLGRHFSEELVFRTSNTWDEFFLNVLPVTNESLPDRSRRLVFEQDYDTSIYNSFEGCSMIVKPLFTVTIASSDYAKILTSVEVEDFANLIVEDGGSLVMVRDCYYTTALGYGCGTEMVNLGPDGIMNATKQTVNLSGAYDYVYWSSPLSDNPDNPKLNEIFNFGSGTGSLFNPNRMYLFQNDKFCDIYRRYTIANYPTVDGYDDNYDDYDPSNTLAEQTAAMIPGRGYATWPPQPATPGNYNYTITFSGEMNNGLVTVPVFRNNSLDGKNINLIGNPYPSAIDLDLFFEENLAIIEPIAYIWTRLTDDPSNGTPGPNGLNYTAANFAVYTSDMVLNTYNNNAINLNGGVLASGQSFFVRTYKNFTGFTTTVPFETAPATPAVVHPQEEILTSDNVVFRNKMRTIEPNTTFARGVQTTRTSNNAEGDKLWLNLTDNAGYTCQLGVYFKPNGSALYNPVEDAATIWGRKYNFYTQTTSEDLIIDIQDGFTTDKIIPLGITNSNETHSQAFTISIANAQGVFNNQAVYLQDTHLGIVHNLSQSVYSFASIEAVLEGRFNLLFSNNLPSFTKQSIEEGLVKVYTQNDTLLVSSTVKKIKEVQVFDIYTPRTSGMLLSNKVGINQNEVALPLQNNIVLLNVRIVLEDGTVINKKIRK